MLLPFPLSSLQNKVLRGRERKIKKPINFLLRAFAGAFLMLLSLETEYPLFVKEPPSHISAEMEKVVDIPCQARGERYH